MSDATQQEPVQKAHVAYLRRLADMGRGRPVPLILITAVSCGAFGLALAAYAIEQAMLSSALGSASQNNLLSEVVGWLFIMAHFVIIPAVLWTAWRAFAPSHVGLSRTARAIWSAALMASITTVVCFAVLNTGQTLPSSVTVANGLVAMFLVMWGSGLWVTSLLNDRPWLMIFALSSFGAAILMAHVGSSYLTVLLLAASLLLLGSLPAVLLMRERRA